MVFGLVKRRLLGGYGYGVDRDSIKLNGVYLGLILVIVVGN